MTVLYYEILRHYRVAIEWINRIPGLLVEYPLFEFTEDNIIQNRTILEKVLLDDRLKPCFDVLEKLNDLRERFDPSVVQIQSDDYLLEKLTVITKTGETTGDSWVYLSLVTKVGREIPCQTLEPTPFGLSDGELAIYLPFHTTDSQSQFRFRSGQEDVFTVKPEVGVRWGNIERIKIQIREPRSENSGSIEWDLAHLYVATSSNKQDWILIDQDVNQRLNRTNENNHVFLDVTPPEGARGPEDLLSDDERICIRKLINHLNDQKLHYQRYLWLEEDPDARAIRFDRLKFRDGRLLDYIENRPVAVLGNYLVFLERERDVEDRFPTLDDDNLATIAERIVSLPTRGVFAEAQLSSCNACEEKDITRFWDWSESPCNSQAPDISSVTSGSRNNPPDVDPATLPNPVVNIVNPPAAPDPTGLSNALSLLATPDIFRDMSARQEVGSLLQGLSEGRISPSEANARAQQLRSGQSNSSSNPSPRQQHEQLQLYRNAESRGDISPSQRRQLAQDYLQNSQYDPLNLQEVASGRSVGLAEHVSNWVSQNLDGSTGKAEVRINQTVLQQLQLTGESSIDTAIRAGADSVKCQYHTVTFSSNKSFSKLANDLKRFQDFPPPSVIEIEKIVGNLSQLKRGDEFRWRISAIERQEALKAVLNLLPVAGLTGVLLKPIIEELAKRRFDIRIISSIRRENVMEFTAQTLADHPYAGRRSWRLKPGGENNLFILETAEVNTYPWLVDYMAEVITHGEDARLTWEQFLSRFVSHVGGTIVDNTNVRGNTIMGNASTIQNDPECKKVMAQFTDLKEAFNLIVARGRNMA